VPFHSHLVEGDTREAAGLLHAPGQNMNGWLDHDDGIYVLALHTTAVLRRPREVRDGGSRHRVARSVMPHEFGITVAIQASSGNAYVMHLLLTPRQAYEAGFSANMCKL